MMTVALSRSLRLVCVGACLAALIGLAPSRAQDGSPVAQAYAATDAKFREIKDNVATAKERLDNVGQQLERVEDFLKKHPKIAPKERAALIRQLGDARGTMQKTGEVLEKFGNYADKATQAADAVNQVREIYQAFRSDQLSDKVRILGSMMEKYGGDVPVLGAAIEAYGKITTGLVDATDKLDKQIGETFRQDQIGSGIHGGKRDPRYVKLVEQFGKDFADQTTYAPNTLREVFRPIDKPLDVALIWDQERNQWYRIDGKVKVESIFHDVVAARGQRPTPEQLKFLAEHDEQNQARQAMADAFAKYLRTASDPRSLSPSSGAFVRLGEDGGKMILALRDPDFQAKFVYDDQFRAWTLTTLDTMRRDLIRQGSGARRSLREFDALLKQHGVTLDSQSPVVPPVSSTPPTPTVSPSSDPTQAQGTLPMTGEVRSVAWRPDNPGFKWGGVWHIKNGHVTAGDNVWKFSGEVRGNSIIGTWTASDGRSSSGTITFHPGGKLDWVDKAGPGLGTWELVSAAPAKID